MKNTIYKYIFYEFLRYFLVALFAFAIIVWTIQAVNFLDLVVEEGHGFRTYFIYSLFTLSKVLTKLIPFCFMLAMILTLSKLEKDNESIMTFSEQSHRIDKFELIDSALKHTQTLSVPSLQSATSLELLDSHHAVSTWAKSDALAVFKIAETKDKQSG